MTAPKTTTKTPAAKASEAAAEAAHVAHDTLRRALAAFQAEMPTIRKGQTASVRSDKGSYTYDYADLSDVTEKAMPLLGRHGLFFSARPTLEGSAFALQYELGHESDVEGTQAIRGVYPLPTPSNPQAMGSAITYARRYVLCAVTGIAPGGDDDDASLAQYSAPAQRPASAPAQRPAAPAAPRRNFAAEASLASNDHAALTALWQEARAAREPVDVLDAIAALGRAAAPAPEDEPVDPGNPEDEAPADAPAEADTADEAVPA